MASRGKGRRRRRERQARIAALETKLRLLRLELPAKCGCEHCSMFMGKSKCEEIAYVTALEIMLEKALAWREHGGYHETI